MKKSKEVSLKKLDLTLAPENFWLDDREHSSTLGYLIPTLNVTKAKPCESVMKLTNKKKRERTQLTNFERWINNFYTTRVFSNTSGGMRREFSMFFKKFSQLISIKPKEKLSVVTCSIRCKISFALLRSCLLHIGGSQKSDNVYEKLN